MGWLALHHDDRTVAANKLQPGKKRLQHIHAQNLKDSLVFFALLSLRSAAFRFCCTALAATMSAKFCKQHSTILILSYSCQGPRRESPNAKRNILDRRAIQVAQAGQMNPSENRINVDGQTGQGCRAGWAGRRTSREAVDCCAARRSSYSARTPSSSRPSNSAGSMATSTSGTAPALHSSSELCLEPGMAAW